MARLRLYIAASVDGFVATPDGSVAWLEPFQAHDYGYAAFMSEVGTVLLGRVTYDQALGFGEWPYHGKRAIVLTSRPLPSPPEGVEAAADLKAVVEDVRRPGEPDVCVVGGGQLIRGLLDLGAIDELELFWIPVLLGDGIPLFEKRSAAPLNLQLVDARPVAAGVVRAVYRPAGSVVGGNHSD